MDLFTGMVDDAGLVEGRLSPEEILGACRQVETRYPAVLGSILVDDRRLVELDRSADAGTPVTVVNTTGAGGLSALSGRTVANLRILAVDSALRDLGDPVGNVARIAAAARELDPEIAVNVVLPDLPGWQGVVGDVEAEGLLAVIGWHVDATVLAHRVEVLVEADVPFRVSGVPDAAALPALLRIVDAVIDGADAAAVAPADPTVSVTAVRDWDAARVARVRRRLQSVRVSAAHDVVDLLGSWELLADGPSDEADR